MARTVFYRNASARDNLDLFLVAAATSLLAVRAYLALTGYPQIGADGLHIAHMLWGGLLMLASIVTLLTFLGRRAMRIASLAGGAGFGIFIDELGKFITSDNNYFFHPTIGIIYAVFIFLYLMFSFINRKQRLSSREYQLNALSQLEEVIVHDMDSAEKHRVNHLLALANQDDPLTRRLQHFLAEADTIPSPKPGLFQRWLDTLDRFYARFWQQRNSNTIIRLFFVLEAVMFVASVWVLLYLNLNGALKLFYSASASGFEATGQLASSVFAAGFAAYGAFLLPTSRMRAYEQFRRATLVNIFLTEFFMFLRISFGALPGFLFSITLLALIGFAIHQERRFQARQHASLTA